MKLADIIAITGRNNVVYTGCSHCLQPIENIEVTKCPVCRHYFVGKVHLDRIPTVEVSEVLDEWMGEEAGEDTVSGLDISGTSQRDGQDKTEESSDKGEGQSRVDMSVPWGLQSEVLFAREIGLDPRSRMS